MSRESAAVPYNSGVAFGFEPVAKSSGSDTYRGRNGSPARGSSIVTHATGPLIVHGSLPIAARILQVQRQTASKGTVAENGVTMSDDTRKNRVNSAASA
jgi:hypothetical protein